MPNWLICQIMEHRMKKATYVVIDTETGGFDPYKNSILSIGVVILRQLKIIDSKIQLESFATVEVIDWASKNITEVEIMRDAFVSYLSSNKSSFGINESINWDGFDNAPQILIVEHYLFRSDYWELALSRHVMIAPHDWVMIYIRPRHQITPIWSGIIDSWSSGNHSVSEIETPSSVYR